MSEDGYKRVPNGFTPAQREQFDRDGFLMVENALNDDAIDRILGAIQRVAAGDPKYDRTKMYSPDNVAEKDPVFAELIDYPPHIGFMYDLYGELLKLHLSQFMLRPPGSWYNFWHPDGGRAVPYGVFAPQQPLVCKVSYWLTDVPRPKMGNLVMLPGSHRRQHMDHYDTHESAAGELIVCVKKGTMTLMNANTWHRVEPNESDVTRANIFYAYCVAWVCPQDRYQNDPEWLTTLTREQRIIMRSYRYPYDNAKPPAQDFPLYLDRDLGLDRDAGVYQDHVQLHRRKRKVAYERV